MGIFLGPWVSLRSLLIHLQPLALRLTVIAPWSNIQTPTEVERYITM